MSCSGVKLEAVNRPGPYVGVEFRVGYRSYFTPKKVQVPEPKWFRRFRVGHLGVGFRHWAFFPMQYLTAP